ncbi:hypothetical protein BC831DRAFT_507699 [Entophlyctis helioformis]|nr:hypothetical protein BC831DRAFT_507699 [Entophlyctis helioformis]
MHRHTHRAARLAAASVCPGLAARCSHTHTHAGPASHRPAATAATAATTTQLRSASSLSPAALRPAVSSYVAALVGSLGLPSLLGRSATPAGTTATTATATARSITTRFNFDTYKLVRQLERQGLTRGQAVAIMRTINAFLVDGTLSLRSATLSTIELENELYLYKSQLQELRNELQLLRQNDSVTLKADTDSVLREIETLNQKFSELVAALKADVAMDLNNHKSDSRELATDTDLRLQEIHHKLVLKMSDIKTRIETMKVELTRMIVWMIIGIVSLVMIVDMIKPPSPQSNEDILSSISQGQPPFLFPFLSPVVTRPRSSSSSSSS